MSIEQRGYYMWGASAALRATTITLRNLMESWGGFAGKALL
jgi:hypothetical protein